MAAPFRPQSDHATVLKAIAALIKSHPGVVVVLAGHGVQKGNAALMALLGSGSLATRAHLLGEWSDLAALYNACDVVCSSALHDGSRMQLVMAMLCGVPCIATGLGAQGEVIGQFGTAAEPGNPSAFVKGFTRLLELTPQKRLHLVRGARKHALQNYIHVRLLQRYLQLYYDLVGCESRGSEDIPAPRYDADVPLAPPAIVRARPNPAIGIDTAVGPDSPRAEARKESLPERRREHEVSKRKQAPAPPSAKRTVQSAERGSSNVRRGSPDAVRGQDDVLTMFEAELAREADASSAGSPLHERARGVVEESEDLLAPEALQMPAPQAAAGSSDALSLAPTGALLSDPAELAGVPQAATRG